MRGYKVFNHDWTCRGFQYEVGKKYEMEEKPVICERGFHFCEKVVDCFEYYRFDSNNKVAEIEAYGELDFEEDGNKHCTNKIKIIRELTWHEVLDLANTGKDCTGYRNSGDYNSGNYNSGNYNSGDRNSGYWNSGNCNSGYRNSGYRNSGNYNSGDRNSGNWNSGSNCVGCFNTISQPLMFFDKQSSLTFEQWRNSDAYWLLNRIDFRPTEWIMARDMTDFEKEKHPEHETTDGYLRKVDNSECCVEWWNGLVEKEKEIIKGIPNFDGEKFYQITGIKVE